MFKSCRVPFRCDRGSLLWCLKEGENRGCPLYFCVPVTDMFRLSASWEWATLLFKHYPFVFCMCCFEMGMYRFEIVWSWRINLTLWRNLLCLHLFNEQLPVRRLHVCCTRLKSFVSSFVRLAVRLRPYCFGTKEDTRPRLHWCFLGSYTASSVKFSQCTGANTLHA